jgi:hypothetical protein
MRRQKKKKKKRNRQRVEGIRFDFFFSSLGYIKAEPITIVAAAVIWRGNKRIRMP